MNEMQDVTDALMRLLPGASSGKSEIESIRHATIGIEHVPALLEDPKSLVKSLGVPVQDHSQWAVTTVSRNDTTRALRRVVIVIIIHYSNCSGVIVVASYPVSMNHDTQDRHDPARPGHRHHHDGESDGPVKPDHDGIAT